MGRVHRDGSITFRGHTYATIKDVPPGGQALRVAARRCGVDPERVGREILLGRPSAAPLAEGGRRHNPADQELGPERLEEAFADLRNRPSGEAVDALMDLVMAHCGGRPVTDDVTVVMVEREG